MTSREYWEQVDEVESRNPGEVLIPSLRRGHSRVNEAYLAAAIKRLPEVVVDYDMLYFDSDIPKMLADDTLRGLWSERTRLFGEMNKLSNHFHDCTTDDQRAGNSKRILAIWAKIQEVKSNIKHYEIHGVLPDPVDVSDDLPENPVALSKKLNSIRARISQKKQQIRDIAALDEGTDGKQAKIDAAEEDLKQLKYLAGLAEQKLKTHEQDEG